MNEFLPICDNLFNIISLAAYFCDCVFDIVFGYALLERGRINFFIAFSIIIAGSLLISQAVSLKWYLRSISAAASNQVGRQAAHDATVKVGSLTSASTSKISKYAVLGLHCLQLGIFWRYAKLFIPVDLRSVKKNVRDLCILRLIIAFSGAAPMLLIQAYLLMTIQDQDDINSIRIKTLGGQLSTQLVHQSTIAHHYKQKTFKDLNRISLGLNLFSVCWALASFSKNVRVHNVHRLVLTWLGVIFQFFWRLGTVTSRILSLTVYASVYRKWIFLVIILHWISMFLWLISPKNAFHGEQISRLRKMALSALVAFIYIFAYINLQEVNHKQKMMIFYIVMFSENVLLVSLWIAGIWPERSDDWFLIPTYVLALFFGGILVMVIYYRYFHIRRLGYDTEVQKANSKLCVCQCNSDNKYSNIFQDSIAIHEKESRGPYTEACDSNLNGKRYAPTNEHLKGIFNCRFSNPANGTKRKKKKPTSFVPPPILNLPGNINPLKIHGTTNQDKDRQDQPQSSNIGGPMTIPFWRQPLPRNSIAGSSETEGSQASSRINIQLKLQEKKQKQLAELKIIEEEIKQGKLGRPKLIGIDLFENEECSKVSMRQPVSGLACGFSLKTPPRAKKHIDIETIDFRRNSSGSEAESMNILLQKLQQNTSMHKNENIMFNNFSSSSSVVTKFSHEMLSIVENTGNGLNHKQPSISSTITSTTSENENNSLKKHMVSSRKKLLHHNIGNNLNVQSRTNQGSPSCLYDPRQSAYKSTEGKHKIETTRPSNSKNELGNKGNTSSIEREKNLASQLIKRQIQRGNTPEILLAANHLESTHYLTINQQLTSGLPGVLARSNNTSDRHNYRHVNDYEQGQDDESQIPSDIDIDSQMSLPRSYTLPREFKFNRQGRKIIKNEHFVANEQHSSDGDVDSCDDNECEGDEDKIPIRNRRTNNLNKNSLHSNSPFNNISPNIVTNKLYQNSYNLRTGMKVNNLDLVNGCIDNRYEFSNMQEPTHSRQNRSRLFGQKTFNRHETKL